MLLTGDQGWTVTAYGEWLSGQLSYALLGPRDGADGKQGTGAGGRTRSV